MSTVVTTWSLQSRSIDELRRARRNADLEVRECEVSQWELNRFLYQWIGAQWRWLDKLVWSEAQWREWVESPDVRTFIAWHRGAIAGYYELHRQQDAIEIAYFGLAGQFIGRGFGGDLLTRTIESAWSWGAQRVWVHTCTLDHASALANYQARGLVIFNERTHTQD
jgi:GNAT superfamily N-acetyltransferase